MPLFTHRYMLVTTSGALVISSVVAGRGFVISKCMHNIFRLAALVLSE